MNANLLLDKVANKLGKAFSSEEGADIYLTHMSIIERSE